MLSSLVCLGIEAVASRYYLELNLVSKDQETKPENDLESLKIIYAFTETEEKIVS